MQAMLLIRKGLLILFILALINPSLLPAATEQRIALIIGNSAYSSGPLKNPVNDASDMAAMLKKLGFSVTLKQNTNQQEMDESIREFGRQLKRTRGVGLFFYAGHGIQIGGVNYLLPVNAKIEKESDVRFQSVNADMVLAEMENAENGLNVVILDACRDNPFSRSFRNATRGLALVSNAPSGTFISYSTGANQVARDGEGRNSPYTMALLENIAKPGLTINDVFMNVRTKVKKETGQIPWEMSSLEGRFYFTQQSDELEQQKAAMEREKQELARQKALDAEREQLAVERRKFEAERAKAEATAKTKAEAEQIAKAKSEAEEIAKAKAKTEEIARAKAKAEAEQIAKARAEGEERARTEAAAKAKADAIAKSEADTIAKAEAKKHELKIVTAAIDSAVVSPKSVTSDGRFEKLASGVVRDTKSGLDWYAGPDKNTTWDDAYEWIFGLKIDGGGWRMPTINELKGLYQKGSGSRNMTAQFENTGWWVWASNSTGENSPIPKMSLDFDDGRALIDKRDNAQYRRGFAVRSRR